jgi:hypothetical protein
MRDICAETSVRYSHRDNVRSAAGYEPLKAQSAAKEIRHTAEAWFGRQGDFCPHGHPSPAARASVAPDHLLKHGVQAIVTAHTLGGDAQTAETIAVIKTANRVFARQPGTPVKLILQVTELCNSQHARIALLKG